MKDQLTKKVESKGLSGILKEYSENLKLGGNKEDNDYISRPSTTMGLGDNYPNRIAGACEPEGCSSTCNALAVATCTTIGVVTLIFFGGGSCFIFCPFLRTIRE